MSGDRPMGGEPRRLLSFFAILSSAALPVCCGRVVTGIGRALRAAGAGIYGRHDIWARSCSPAPTNDGPPCAIGFMVLIGLLRHDP